MRRARALLRAALVGGSGGLLGFALTEPWRNYESFQLGSALQVYGHVGPWSAVIAFSLGLALLTFGPERPAGRVILKRALLFAWLGFLGGITAQTTYFFVQNSLTRGFAWAVMGAHVGLAMGVLGRDRDDAARGVLGGALGGMIGGYLFNSIGELLPGGHGTASRALGLLLMGTCVAVLMQLVKEALRKAWVQGITPGPCEAKEYALNVSRVTVGRAEFNQLSLVHDPAIPEQAGLFEWRGDQGWFWVGGSVLVNGRRHNEVALRPDDCLMLGETRFLFQTRNQKRRKAATWRFRGWWLLTLISLGPATLLCLVSLFG